ncbi:hypothetical protein JVT61DRAFT_3141 [Boletus reticuloceps]|uniref:Uncharacterized protein n=1 Tax=Boletus reticuloceps TaxID=495285 RepID=A0A8I3AAD8_9AGAM|nr:hypothetical protein JVT61DRAFT_3141 [Boletus reticuloceps]
MLSARPAGLTLDTDRVVSTKTPGRVLSKTRNVLQENATRSNVPMTVMAKGRKAVQNTPLQSRTLQTDRVLKDLPGKQVGPSKLKDTPAIRPLGDKTPFPNRTAHQLPASGTKISKPALLDGSLRPSFARKHDRLPRSASKFETPITGGKHWDVSDIEIEVDVPVANQSIQEESCDEIEYMPPKVEDVPYEPPFEMPNYREVGKSLMALIRSYSIEDDLPSTDMTFTIHASEKNFFVQPTLPQREIEDDSPFARAKPKPEPKSRSPTALKQKSTVTSKPTSRPAAQRTMPATRTTTVANSRVLSTVRRQSTTSTARPPTTTARISSSQPVTRAPTSQSTLRAPTSRATTRAPSVTRSTPLVRAGVVQPSRATSVSRPPTKSAMRPTPQTASLKGKPAIPQSIATPAARKPVPPSNVPPNTERPRSGTITKEAFESNKHVVVHIRNNSLEDVKKDLEGLIVFGDAFDDDDGFLFDV